MSLFNQAFRYIYISKELMPALNCLGDNCQPGDQSYNEGDTHQGALEKVLIFKSSRLWQWWGVLNWTRINLGPIMQSSPIKYGDSGLFWCCQWLRIYLSVLSCSGTIFPGGDSGVFWCCKLHQVRDCCKSWTRGGSATLWMEICSTWGWFCSWTLIILMTVISMSIMIVLISIQSWFDYLPATRDQLPTWVMTSQGYPT